ncbi:MAG: SPOR domain-containing protein [candidate division Zixibacteria bacterium]|nr:SPOR domain-containing protein [candidate division Zixibacteria bacterium]
MKTKTVKGLLFLAAALGVPFSPLGAKPNLTSAWQEYFKGAFGRAADRLKDYMRDTATAEAYILSAKLEPDGSRAREFLEKALEDPARGEFFRRALVELCQYHLAVKNHAAILQLRDRFPAFFEKQSFNPELAYYLAKAYRLLGRPEEGLKFSEEILVSYPVHPVSGWAALEKGLSLLSAKKPDDGVAEFRQVVARGGSAEVTIALELLSKNLPSDKAKIYARLYQEKFPNGLGKLSGENGKASPKRYQIEIGPFGNKGEAQRAFLKLKGNSKEAEITSRPVNNRTYYFILWGVFSSESEAGKTKKELEKILKASYSVIEMQG